MMLMIIVALLLLGLCLGSFVNALVWRTHEQSKPRSKRKSSDEELSLAKGRSMCTDCRHVLSVRDLIPIISWLSLRGKCRYCRKPISWQYPLVELSTAALFVGMYVFWPDTPFHAQNSIGLAVWLASLVGLIALVVYDIRWMLLPNKIVFPLLILASLGVVVDTIVARSPQPVLNAAGGLIVGGGLFYVLFQVSKGKWIGGGDVKLGFLLGLLLGAPVPSLLMLFIASLLGSLVTIPLLASKKVGPKTRIPFGPFLIAAAIIVQLFGEAIIRWYVEKLIG